MARVSLIARRFFTAAAAALATCYGALSPAVAQTPDRTPQPTFAVVTGDNVLVRSGAADSYYPFGRVHRGTVVEVIGEKFNWTRVATRGPAFAPGTGQGQFFGHIIFPQTETGRFRVNPDGKTGVTLGRMDVLAPNLNTNFNPGDSWKPLVRLEPETTVRILSTTTSSNNTVHLIALPESAEGWISKAHLREATKEEVEAWRRGSTSRSESAPVRPSSAPAEKKEEQKGPPTPATSEQRVESAPAAPVAPQREPETPRAEPAEIRMAEAPQGAPPVQPVLAREEATAPAPAPASTTESAAAPFETDKDAKGLVKEVAKATMEDLEVLLVKMRSAPAEIAEIANLRQMYQEFAIRNSSDRAAARFAKGRADQLEIWREVRERQAELARIRERARRADEQAEMALLTIYSHADYDAIGRLTASTIYDGQRLPKMLRLQEPGTNRTLAYVEPEGHGFDMIEMLGLWLGVVGDKSYDPALRLNIITPKRIDLLAPKQ